MKSLTFSVVAVVAFIVATCVSGQDDFSFGVDFDNFGPPTLEETVDDDFSTSLTVESRGPAPQFAPAAAAAAAGSNGRDCYCQCSSLQFIDSYGRRQGNCRTTHKGARWCYIRPSVRIGRFGRSRRSTCSDTRRSRRFRGVRWSFQACATPSTKHPICRRFAVNPFTGLGGAGGGSSRHQVLSSSVGLRSSLDDVGGDGGLDDGGDDDVIQFATPVAAVGSLSDDDF